MQNIVSGCYGVCGVISDWWRGSYVGECVEICYYEEVSFLFFIFYLLSFSSYCYCLFFTRRIFIGWPMYVDLRWSVVLHSGFSLFPSLVFLFFLFLGIVCFYFSVLDASTCVHGYNKRLPFKQKGEKYEKLTMWRKFSPDVEFCGYSIPHPSEAKMNLRIQTYGKPSLSYPANLRLSGITWAHECGLDGVSVYGVLEKALEDLMAMCDVVEEKFTVARDEFVNRMES